MNHKPLENITAALAPPEELPDRRDKHCTLDELMAHYLVPGCSVAIFDGDEHISAGSYGSTGWHIDGQSPVTPNTIFQACSISKAVTAVGALRLVDAGQLALDEDVNTYLTSWQIPINNGWQPRITLRHLLTHTAGLNYYWFPGYGRDEPTPTTLQTLAGQSPANTPPVQVTGIPRAEFRYSGAHYAVIEMLMEDVTGEPFPSLMQRLIFAPLGMEDSSFDQSFPESRPEAVAIGHDLAGVPLTGGWRIQPEHAGAGLWTTPVDLCRLAVAVQKASAGDPEDFLSLNIASDMFTPGPGNRGLGWQMQMADGLLWFGHGGSNVGYKCHLIADTAQPRGAAIMTNGDAGSAIYSRIFEAIARDYGWPEDVAPGRSADFRAPAINEHEFDPEIAAACAGSYQLETGLRLLIDNRGDRLELHAGDQAAIELLPVSGSTFLAADVNATIHFRIEPDGSAKGLDLHQFGEAIAGKRVT